MIPTRGLLLTGLLVLAQVACASAVPAVPVAPGSRVVVRLYDARSGIELALANESHPELRHVYSEARASATLKLAPDQLIGELLASLDLAGFATYGQPAPHEPPRERGFVSVSHDDLLRVVSEPSKGADAELRQAWSRLKLVMDYYYQHVGSLQFVTNPKGDDVFRERP